jgi:hypothetical protein
MLIASMHGLAYWAMAVAARRLNICSLLCAANSTSNHALEK